jgi:N-acetylmuramoyl-L-alanine amidase
MGLHVKGKCSFFGGPADSGVSPSEGLAFIWEVSQKPELFLSYQPPGTTGLARRLNSDDVFYVACRWDYNDPDTTKTALLEEMALVRAPKTGKEAKAYPADWGPHEEKTGGRVADLSKALLDFLQIETDDEVEVIYPFTSRGTQPDFGKVAISSGHSLKCQGAVGILNEVECARAVVDRVAQELLVRGVEVVTFHDNESTTQQQNLERITAWHNSQTPDLNIMVHLNAYVETTSPMGCEVLYVTQAALADHMSSAMAVAGGLMNRGGKKRTDLYVLNQTVAPAVLPEICFVDSSADAAIFNDKEKFSAICNAIAEVVSGVKQGARPPNVASLSGRVSVRGTRR